MKIFLRTSVLIPRYINSRPISTHQGNDAPIDPPDETLLLSTERYEKSSQDINTLRSRLLYQSRKRGMLENGLILSHFAAKYLATMNKTQLDLYDKLINTPSNDWDLYNWVVGIKETPKEFNNEVMELLKAHVNDPNVTYRNVQPSLY